MKSSLIFEFTVDKENASVHVTREFDASLDKVWRAWTEAELLDQWWAPRPYRTETKSLNFEEGGRWLYSMVGPKNDRHWCRADYQDIEDHNLITWEDAFCDENGHDNNGKPNSLWTTKFSENNGITTVDVVLRHDSLESLETQIQMGFQEGFTMALGNLDELLVEI